ncbi:penicillin-binding protein 1C [candidate division KSB1 bacterium]|nr:penicillin-binding protein 1C [candidate division KSB1 bacterium]
MRSLDRRHGLGLSIVVILVCLMAWPLHLPRDISTSHQSMRILDCHGQLLREVLSDKEGWGTWIDIQTLPPYVIDAFIAIEDKRFFYHPGIDILAILRAARQNVSQGRIVSGGSTITQQVVKRLYDPSNGYMGKLLEAWKALRLELWNDKRTILAHYMNRIPFGNQTYGIEAASRLYFDKPARHLSLSEATFLAGLPQAPSAYDPYRHLSRAQKRQTRVYKALQQNNFGDSETLHRARNITIAPVSPDTRFRAPHFCNWLLQSRKRQPVIKTSLDWGMQSHLESLVKSHIARLGNSNVSQAAVIVLDNRSGTIKSWIGSADFFSVQHAGQVDGCIALRQPGSALKPFTYALALEQDMTLATILPDVETHAWTRGGDFNVHNYDERFHGPVRLGTALACSYNVPAVRLLEKLGTDRLLTVLKQLGMTTLNKPESHYGLGLTLGNGEVTLLELTTAYMALARGGLYRVASIRSDPQPEQRIFSPVTAFLISHCLSDPALRAPAFGMGGPLQLPFDCAVKTGTSKDFRDNWTVGYTSAFTVGVWVGNFDGTPMHHVSGVSGAAPLFHDIMMVLHRKKDPNPFLAPSGVVSVAICPVSGQIPGPFCMNSRDEWFARQCQPADTCQIHQNFVLDTRNGLLATSHTPENFKGEKIFEVWPSVYWTWMQEQNMQLPPQRISPLGYEKEFSVSFPDHGDIFHIDPILRREYQTLMLQAAVSIPADTITWFIDGRPYKSCARPFNVRWPLEKGRHTLEIRTKELSSNTVTIEVY